MPLGWRSRVGFAIIAVAAVAATVRASAIGATDPTLVLRTPEGTVLAELRAPNAEFILRYRNSLYGTLAEEHYEVTPAGAIVLVGLGAEQLAVLEEYYAIDRPARPATTRPMRWVATPARDVVIDELVVAATDRGERTLIVAGAEPILLTELVDDRRPSVMVEARSR